MAAPDWHCEGFQGGAVDCAGDRRGAINSWWHWRGSGALEPAAECRRVESMVSNVSGKSEVGVAAQNVADVRGGICVRRIVFDGGDRVVIAEAVGGMGDDRNHQFIFAV